MAYQTRQRRIIRRIEPEAPPPAYPAQLPNACSHKAPCGGECILDGGSRHRYHTCRQADCPHCHDPKRFGRMADDHLLPWHQNSEVQAEVLSV